MRRPRSDQTPDALLDAAEAVVARDGIASLTLDAVAAEVPMSKGGVLHHFPSKDRLVEAMVVRSAECWRAQFTHAFELMSPGPGRMARAMACESRRMRNVFRASKSLATTVNVA